MADFFIYCNETSVSIKVFEFLEEIIDLFILSVLCIYLQSIHPPTNALNKIQEMTIIKTPTCFGTGVPSSGKYRTRPYKPTMLVCPC
jgi:hypothetical protein